MGGNCCLLLIHSFIAMSQDPSTRNLSPVDESLFDCDTIARSCELEFKADCERAKLSLENVRNGVSSHLFSSFEGCLKYTYRLTKTKSP